MFFRTPFEPLVFSKNDTPSTRKPRFLRSGGSQNGANMTPKMEPTWSQNQAPVRGASGRASGSDFGGSWRVQEAPQRLPKSAPGAPRSAQGAPPKRPNRTLRPPGGLWESFRAPQDLILELLKLTFPYFWDPPATQQRILVLCSLLALLSPLLSPSWVLGPDARPANFDPGT